MTVPKVLNPYRDTARLYLKAGFRGPLILPYGQKEKPPSAFTGITAPYPDEENIKKWLNDGERHNICVRLAGISDEQSIIGIDVDDYKKGNKKKEGGKQLKELENRLGPLPQTWIATSRVDGTSGIRFYLVPRLRDKSGKIKDFAFKGKVAEDIETIQKRHRYAVVWPSVHPEGGTYWWYPPGVSPDKKGREVWDGKIPDARKFPDLPEAWIDYLTNNRLVMPEDEFIDMDSPVDKVENWASATFLGFNEEPCSMMRRQLDKHILKINNSQTLHDRLTDAHWELLHLAFEGHQGWNVAIDELEEVWIKAVSTRGGTTVRDFSAMKGEIFRSKSYALRKIKGKSDNQVEIGARPLLSASCLTTGKCGVRVADGSKNADADQQKFRVDGIPKGALKAVSEYERNDVGNANLLFDYFSTVEHGPSMRWVKDYGWIIWKQTENPHWETDKDGNQLMFDMWEVAREHQKKYVEGLMGDWKQKIDDFSKGLNGVTTADVKAAQNKYATWNKFVESNGNIRNTENAVKRLTSMPGIKINIDDLDSNKLLLGVANGVLELDRDNINLRPAVMSDYITMNTGVPWEKPKNYAQDLWDDFLNTFVPELELRRALQVALGYCLLGGNKERVVIVLKGKTSTGKSTIVDSVIAALGDYASPVNQSFFQDHKLNPLLANAAKKRIVGCTEFDSTVEISPSHLKRISGEDEMLVEKKYSNESFNVKLDCVPIMATNNVPKISPFDKAVEIRLHVFPFDHQVMGRTNDTDKRDMIKNNCKTAILKWLVEGFIEYRRLGELPVTQSMKEAKGDFIGEIDDITAFRKECVFPQTSPEGYVTREAMHTCYLMWCDENSIAMKDRVSSTMLTQRLKSMGIESPNKKIWVKSLDKSKRCFVGVRLVKPNEKVSDISGRDDRRER